MLWHQRSSRAHLLSNGPRPPSRRTPKSLRSSALPRSTGSRPPAESRHPLATLPASQQRKKPLLLSGGHAGIWTRSEIELESSASPLDVQDALDALQASGLINLHDELVTPTRAAQRMDELEL